MRLPTLRTHFAGSFARRLLATALLAFASVPALAEDIDIFTGKPAPGNEPNILVIIDSSSNWSASFGTAAEFTAAGCPSTDTTKFAAEMCVLKQVATAFSSDVRIGLMMFAESGENGGYVRFAIRNVGPDSAASLANRQAFVDLLSNFVKSGTGTDNSGSNQPYGKVMFEAFKYFGGGTGTPKDRLHFGPTAFAGWTTDSGGDTGARRRDYVGNSSGSPTGATANRAAQRYGADNFAAFANQSSKDYIKPIKTNCPKNFIIFLSNGNPSTGGDSGGSAPATTLLANVGGNTAQITSGGVAIHASSFDEWARFLNNVDVDPDHAEDQKIITFTVSVYQPTGFRLADGSTVATRALCVAAGQPLCTPIASNTDQQMINLMSSAATAGGGLYFDGSDISGIRAAFARILNEVQAKNSVFVSASLPVSVNTQGTFLNQVYMGMFRPEATGNPRWLGNLKHYKIVQDPLTLALNLADSNNNIAINPATGFVSPAAVSYWTSPNDFWKNAPSGTPKIASDSPDGEIVEKGGAGEQIRLAYGTDQTPRNKMYTCPSGGCSAGALNYTFDNGNITGAANQTAFGVASAAELALMVNWIRGQDNVKGTPCDPLVVTTPACTWASAESGPGWNRTIRPSVHGDVLHSRPVVLNYKGSGPYIFYGANDGTLRGTKGGRLGTDGKELWAFVAPEFYGKFKRLRDNKPVLKFPDTDLSITPTPQPKDYFFDGAIGSYQQLDSGGATTAAYIYVTARRGGRLLYAFEVTDPTAPKFMWMKSPADPDARFKEMGQTWSEPKAFKVRGWPNPVLMFGAGYDPAEDGAAPVITTMGRGVYVLDAVTGDIVKFFTTSENAGALTSSIPSDIAVIDHDFDTLADRAYVGDQAGNVWRMDIDDADPAAWKMYQIATLGPDRKFFFRPDVVISKTYDLVLIGSGDREKPTFGSSTDRFYMLKDDKTGKSGAGGTIIKNTDLVAGGTDSSSAKGWYLEMRKGEKVINAPLSIGGVTYFSTNRPTPDPESCQPNLGEARAYAVDFLTGNAGADRNGDGTKNSDDLSTVLKSGGLPPSPVGGVVQLDDGKLVDFIIGSGAGGSPIAPEKPVREIPKVRRKLYWNTNSDK
jgi:type IV pilus assembly protein PilY1